ncbi:hypothetical protein BCR39DRAFT_511164 [Naematelia encephala]|uniref:RING-type domain-containing protein n=1 Tax=Naematelia encephala TaxID=71784 RepID=A0A1Y2BLH3_9TREE|nr:hypothetical protein BCR39DRAFT_511164 [Naematelia encephala]
MMFTSPRPSLASLLLVPGIYTTIIYHATPAAAYIPAMPVNDTSGLNLTDSSTIAISWTDPAGVYSGAVSYQLKADVATGGQTSGALVHFTEASAGENLTTSTPWIAYISCDVNETMASMEWDIFTLARDRGAVSALLYTAQSQSCLLNQEYIQDFEKPLDVFATKTVQVARVIDNQFVHTNDTFYTYNGALLNVSGTAVNDSLANNPPDNRTFLIGTLTARNSTGQASPTEIPGATATASNQSAKHKAPASMIALYVITGFISACFVLMICLGARRAMRNPERYGRRRLEGEGGGPQTTAGGIGQAILDTFPVIKFNRSAAAQADREHFNAKRMSSDQDVESTVMPELGNNAGSSSQRESIALRSLRTEESVSYHSALEERDDDISVKSVEPRRSKSIMSPSGSRRTSGYDLQNHALLEQAEGMGDQCPICLLDFEEGDDLRVLPCEREHVYHQACIDPWLLQVSSSCPLCRKDFNNPNPAPTPPAEAAIPSPTSPSHPPTHSGFPKYLAFMRRERRGRHRSGTQGTSDSGVGPGRRREADQMGPGGY